MLQICAASSIPNFNSLYHSALSAMTFPPGILNIPLLPALPNPIFPGFSSINMDVVAIIQQLQSYQLLVTFKAFLQPLVLFLGISLASILPKIPHTNLTLLNLLALTPTVIYNILANLPISILTTIPGVPNPLFYTVNIPAVQIVIAIQGIINGYLNALIAVVVSLINQVVGILHIGGLPTIPTVPTMAQLQAMIILPGLPLVKVEELLQKYSLNALLALAVIPGFPSLPALPNPLIPSINSVETTLMIGLGLLYTNYVMYPMTIIFNFIESILSHHLSFTFPKICITI